MFCFVEQLCIPDCGEVAKKAEAEAVFKELLASCTSRLARTTLGVRLIDLLRDERHEGVQQLQKLRQHKAEHILGRQLGDRKSVV